MRQKGVQLCINKVFQIQDPRCQVKRDAIHLPEGDFQASNVVLHTKRVMPALMMLMTKQAWSPSRDLEVRRHLRETYR